MKTNSLVKSAGILIILTAASKLLGFGREVSIAYLFGASAQTDAYLMALSIPTLLFTGVSAAISSVFIPVFDRYHKQGRGKPLLVKFLAIGAGITVFAFIIPTLIFSRQLVSIFAPGFDAATADMTMAMLRILTIIILFRFFSAVIRAVLHVERNFVIPGLEGFPYNIFIIGVSFALYRYLGIYALVWGTLFGVAAQTLFKTPWLLRTKFQGGWWDNCRDGLREIFYLLPPVIIGSMATQIKVTIDRMFASTLAEGSISYLNYANRLVGLPQGLLVTAVITVIYPSLVSFGNGGELKSFRETYIKAINSMQFMLIPMIVGFWVLALPIIELVYQRGNFSDLAVTQTVAPLRFYGLSLIGSMLTALTVKAMYALGDTKLPLVSTGVMIVTNIILNFLLIGPLQHGGLALATSIASFIGGGILVYLLARKIGGLNIRRSLIDGGKSVLAALIMGGVIYLAYTGGLSVIPGRWLSKLALLLATTVLGAGVYFLGTTVFKVQGAMEAKLMLDRVLERLKGRNKN